MLLDSRSVSEEPEDPSCTLEEIERSQKDLLERDLQEVKHSKMKMNGDEVVGNVSLTSTVLMSPHSPDVSASRLRTFARTC